MRRYVYISALCSRNKITKPTIMKIAKLTLIGLLFAAALFTTGCEKSPADDAAEATEEVTEAAE